MPSLTKKSLSKEKVTNNLESEITEFQEFCGVQPLIMSTSVNASDALNDFNSVCSDNNPNLKQKLSLAHTYINGRPL